MAEASNTIGSGTVAGALQYLDFLSAKGHVAPGAISALKSGFSKVMRTLGEENWEKIEVRSIDIDEYMTRFANMTQGQYNAKSLVDYGSRVRKVTSWYLEFLSKPGWTPNVKTIPRRSTKSSKPTENSSIEAGDVGVKESVEITEAVNIATSPTVQPNLIAFPFPLSDGTLSTLYLPPSISSNDADRLSRFVQTLVINVGRSDDT